MDNATVMRFWSKVDVGDVDACWLWKPLGSTNGYGQFSSRGKTYLAHRLAYELSQSPIPPGMTIDHLCRVRNCVNPAHLDCVTKAENLRRAKSWENGAEFQRNKTHCVAGHPYSGDNLRICKSGKRACRTCERRYTAEWRARQRILNPPKPPAPKLQCRNGHLYAEHGRIGGDRGGCRQCAREATRRSRARAKALQQAADPT
ncbi:hypothetical protein GCM10010331_49130 [Streptomyces xanthochromogenes]|uniref:HNH endonuclease signature motif containing protein n=1 Tax=Streptomyces xanthochromogenes TaxID=67384 RepID=UPI0016761A51|nr:hypothetical protein GCM10010331_49130 [Streptomyces xanthochromogenes]